MTLKAEPSLLHDRVKPYTLVFSCSLFCLQSQSKIMALWVPVRNASPTAKKNMAINSAPMFLENPKRANDIPYAIN
jgi:hypothetical protein